MAVATSDKKWYVVRAVSGQEAFKFETERKLIKNALTSLDT